MVITLWLFNIAMENPPIFNRETIYFYGHGFYGYVQLR